MSNSLCLHSQLRRSDTTPRPLQDEEIRRLKTQLECKDEELAGARATLGKLKSELSDRVAQASAR